MWVAVDITEVPTKCVTYTRQLTVAAQVQFIDLEGRSDGESVQKLVTGLKYVTFSVFCAC